MEKDYYTVKEFAEKYGKSKDRLYEWLRSGYIRSYPKPTPHSVWRIPTTELDRLKSIDLEQPAQREVVSEVKEKNVQEFILTEEIREYDKEVFKKLDKMMNDKDFWEYFYYLKAGHSSHSKKIDKLVKYLYYTEFESYKHVYPTFKNLFSDFLKKLDDLERHIAPHSFSCDGNLDKIEVMPYEHRKHMSQQEFQEYTDRFMELVDIAEKAYIDYRAAIRDILYI